MAAIAQLVRDWVLDRILDSSTGFNYWINTLATGADYPDVSKFSMSNLQTSGLNVFIGNFSEKILDSVGVDATYPLCIIYTRRGDANKLRYTPAEYSGTVDAMIQFWVTGSSADLPTGIFEQTHDLILDAMLETFNRGDVNSIPIPRTITYNNDLRWDRGQIIPGGENWKQVCGYALTFNVPAMDPR